MSLWTVLHKVDYFFLDGYKNTDPMLAKSVLAADRHGCVEGVLSIIALLGETELGGNFFLEVESIGGGGRGGDRLEILYTDRY